MISADVGRIPITTMAKPLFEVLDQGDNSFDLDGNNYKRYIHIRVNNIKKTFVNGDTMVRTDTSPSELTLEISQIDSWLVPMTSS